VYKSKMFIHSSGFS